MSEARIYKENLEILEAKRESVASFLGLIDEILTKPTYECRGEMGGDEWESQLSGEGSGPLRGFQVFVRGAHTRLSTVNILHTAAVGEPAGDIGSDEAAYTLLRRRASEEDGGYHSLRRITFYDSSQPGVAKGREYRVEGEERFLTIAVLGGAAMDALDASGPYGRHAIGVAPLTPSFLDGWPEDVQRVFG